LSDSLLSKHSENLIQQDHSLPWIRVCSESPYFEDERGEPWMPIGQNDAITWQDFKNLFKRKNISEVDNHMAFLASHGVTCIRMMMEYCQTENRYFEKPVGRFQPNMVQFWDDLFKLCEKYKIRLLITPFDTFWMARRWKFHPYNKISGGPCKSKWQWLTSPGMLIAIKNRFSFFIERWGSSGVLFGWDLWNEISPRHASKNMEGVYHYIDQISQHIRDKEMQLYQKNHLQTLSVFAPLMEKYDMTGMVYAHPRLDFASTHFYHTIAIDNPREVQPAAIVTGEMVKKAIQYLPAGRPFLDSEHGPITYFRRNKKGMPEDFDDSYFLHMQWAHFSSGAAGGGMRWPYRNPHVLTHGMRRAQLNLAEFAKLIDWEKFQRTNLNEKINIHDSTIHTFGCGDSQQAIVWLLKASNFSKNIVQPNAETWVSLSIPGLKKGIYKVIYWDTVTGFIATQNVYGQGKILNLQCYIVGGNIAIAVKKISS
jgi:hypothetical protein